MRKFLLAISVLALALSAKGQGFQPYQKEQKVKRGFRLLLGPTATYYKGPGSRSITPLSSDHLNWGVNAQFGYIFNPEGRDQGNMLAVFGTAGMLNSGTLKQLFDDQNIDGSSLANKGMNTYFKLEAGFYIAEIVRMSAGVGQQQYQDALGTKTLEFYSSTLGLSFNMGAVNWIVDFNWMFGRDFGSLVLTPSTGFLVKF